MSKKIIIGMFDTSYSMAEYHFSGYIKKAADNFFENIKTHDPDATVIITSFSNIIKISAPVLAKDLLITEMGVGGDTALYKAVCDSVKVGESLLAPDGTGVLFIITDGLNTSHKEYKAEFDETIERIKSNGWEICYIGSNQRIVEYGIEIGIPATSCVSFVEGKPETLLNLARAVGQSMYSRKPGDKLDMRALSAPTSRTPPPPPHHPRLIRYGGGVIADVIVPPMSGSILFASSPIPGRGLSRGVTYGTGVGLASYMSDGLSRGFTYG